MSRRLPVFLRDDELEALLRATDTERDRVLLLTGRYCGLRPVAGKRNGQARAAEKAPDLSHISEGLRVLAWPVDQLQFHLDNPRNHTSEHIDDVARGASARLDAPRGGAIEADAGADWDALKLKVVYEDIDTGNDECLDGMLAALVEEMKIMPEEEKMPGPEPEPAGAPSVTCPECGHVFSSGRVTVGR